MRLYKILALMYADMVLFRNSKWKLAESFYFPITTIIIWGLFSVFVKDYALQAGVIVLAVNILWYFAVLAQSHVNMQMNEDSWSGSLKQIIITGVSDFEYITARIFSAIILSVFVLVIMLAIAFFAFDLTLFVGYWQLFIILIGITLLSSIALSIIVAGAMVALGREYGFLAWTAMQIFILLSAPFYPVSVFPDFIRPLVAVMPYTGVFEATRDIVAGSVNFGVIEQAFFVSLAYFIVSIPFYRYIFKRARRKGWFVRLS